ncbi:MAG: LysR family transcriptional regulator substrate-binding protein [Bradymonadia bacterium]
MEHPGGVGHHPGPARPDHAQAGPSSITLTAAEVSVETATALEAPDLDALRHIPFVAYPEGTTHRDLQFEALSWAPEEVLSANSADAILAFVAAGLGFSLIPWIAEVGPDMPDALAWPIDTAQFPILAVARAGQEDPLVEMALSMAGG